MVFITNVGLVHNALSVEHSSNTLTNKLINISNEVCFNRETDSREAYKIADVFDTTQIPHNDFMLSEKVNNQPFELNDCVSPNE